MKKGSTKKALATSIASTCVCATMLAGATFAWFTDTASTNVNKIQAGTLDIALLDAGGNSVEGKTLKWKTADKRAQDKILWEPGATYELQPVKVVNEGNLALKYKVMITGIDGDAELNEAIDWKINGVNINESQALAVGASKEIQISGTMKTTAGNEYQGKSIENVAVTVVATQDTVEKDSYSDQYDKDAVYPVIVTTADELKTALEEGGTVILANDFNVPSTLSQKSLENVFATITKDVVLDLNGKKLTVDLSNKGDNHTSVFNVRKGGKLTITGKGTIHTIANRADDKVSAMINNESGDVVIENGTFTMAAGSYDEGYLIPTLVDNNSNLGNANLTINGGTFKFHRNMFRNFANAAGHNDYAKATITINGGTFEGTDANGAAIWNQRPTASVDASNNYGEIHVKGGTFDNVVIDNEWSASAVTKAVGVDVLVNHE